MPVLFSYRSQSINLLCNQLTGFYMWVTPAFNELKLTKTIHKLQIKTFLLKMSRCYVRQDFAQRLTLKTSNYKLFINGIGGLIVFKI